MMVVTEKIRFTSETNLSWVEERRMSAMFQVNDQISGSKAYVYETPLMSSLAVFSLMTLFFG
ncbi:hypothetical protein QT716_11230 [Sporosarcina aquimarina]|uniref:Uncharacterized protein n=1 Tax=Sporosarcina aquimarina TaxID=114975 RepID=A0ABU4G0V9_9BACL|nr:hypothetical protein [Sporosarcina aquimarina]